MSIVHLELQSVPLFIVSFIGGSTVSLLEGFYSKGT